MYDLLTFVIASSRCFETFQYQVSSMLNRLSIMTIPQVLFRSPKMHASNFLKGVLKHRSANSSSPYQQSGNATPDNTTTRGKRASSPDNTLPCTNSTSKKSSSLAKMACLCAPTKHVGSFRCRLHRVTQKHWSGRPLGISSTSNASTSSILPASDQSSGAPGSLPRSKILPAPPPGSNSRTAVCRPSRLRMVVVAAQSEDVVTSVDECSSPHHTE